MVYNIVQETIDNGGATILFSNATGKYIVGDGKCGVVIGSKEYLPNALARVCANFHNIYNYYDGIGTWFDSNTGNYHVDPINVYHDLDSALTKAKLNNEISIYDTETGEVIYV